MIENGFFKWSKTSPATLRSINLSVGHDMLVTVVGQVGSGKSSLLLSIMGEMITESGTTVSKVNFPLIIHVAINYISKKKEIIFFLRRRLLVMCLNMGGYKTLRLKTIFYLGNHMTNSITSKSLRPAPLFRISKCSQIRTTPR